MRTSLYSYCQSHKIEFLIEQWHPTKNKPLTPQTISYGSKIKVWWQCEKGHQWQAAVYSRTGNGSGCPYCTGKAVYPGENDLKSNYPWIAAQWHPTGNGTLTPDKVMAGSHRKVWWVCENGHEWQAEVKSRVVGHGCPICANRNRLKGKNDMATTNPELARQWHPTKNGTLTPQEMVTGSHRKIWWRCEKGHEWQTTVASRLNGAGCPVCAGKKILPGENDLASCFPIIAAQWHPTKNGLLTPDKISPSSHRKVWWQCSIGHAYQSCICARTVSNSNCPYCTGRKVLAGFNDLATLKPDVAAQWHPTLNGTLTPSNVTPGSHRKVWWLCSEGHVWKAVIYSRTGKKKCGCPVCAGKVKDQNRYKNILAESKITTE